MARIRALRWPAIALAAAPATLLFAACGESEERVAFTPDAAPEASSPSPQPAEQPDGGPRAGHDAAAEPVVCAVTPCAVELAAGANHVCARMAEGDVRCWGDDTFGAIGNGSTPADAGADDGGDPKDGDPKDGDPKGGDPKDGDPKDGDPGGAPKDDAPKGDTSRPTAVTDIAGATQISAAHRTTCARLDDGSVRCWGGNAHGQLGLAVAPAIADDLPHPYASPVALTGAAERVDVGQRSACAVLATGALACWGSNERQQLARPERGVLGPVTGDLAGFAVTRAAASEVTTYGLTGTAGSVKLLSWGALGGRQGSLDPDPVPAVLPELDDVHDVAVGPTHACAIAGGSVYCWGSSTKYALCTGLPSSEREPAHAILRTIAYPQQIAVSRNGTCVRLTDGSLQCCGDASRGQLALPPPDGGASALSFTPASGFTGYAVQVVTTDLATCALLASGAVECWGGNTHGELGRGTRDDEAHPSPERVTFP
ncbi:MAG: hypothetical protein KF850_34015 [Labilithrix sp.]|nr:hypothetical protein [Labilithrix sp.]